MKRKKKPIHIDKSAKKGKLKTYKKIGGGMFRLPNYKWVKTGDVFEANPKDIPPAFHDLIVEVKAAKKSKEDKDAPTITGYKKEERTSAGWWDVIDSNGVKVNDTAMREDAADTLIKELTSAL